MEIEMGTDTMPNPDISSVADDRPVTKAKECIADVDLSSEEYIDKLVRQYVAEDMAFWFPPDTRFDYDAVVIAQVDKHTMDEARRNNEEPDELFFRQSEEMREKSQNYALAALLDLRKRGHNLELVKVCLYESEDFAGTLRVHFNFKAKKANDPRAPAETYFTQLLDYGKHSKYTVERCISLGESNSLPYDREKRGCRICSKYVHHPKRGCNDGIW